MRARAAAVLAVLGAAACDTDRTFYRYQTDGGKLKSGTVVGSIGVNGIVTYQPGRDVVIPIRLTQIGGPHDEIQTTVAVSLYGTSPPQQNEYFVRQVNPAPNSAVDDTGRSKEGSQAPTASQQRFVRLTKLSGDLSQNSIVELVIQKEYLDHVGANDHLQVQVETLDSVGQASEPALDEAARAEETSVALKSAQDSFAAALNEQRGRELDQQDALGSVAKARDIERIAEAELVALGFTVGPSPLRNAFAIGAALADPNDARGRAARARFTDLMAAQREAAAEQRRADAKGAELAEASKRVLEAKAAMEKAGKEADAAARAYRDARRKAEIARRQTATKANSTLRTLTLIPAALYRKERGDNTIPIYDLMPFPLSATQTTYLFGSKIERNFYVIGLAVQNSSAQDRVVNTGMIRVSGLALVRSFHKDDPWFTIPVQVAPQSREHVYTILDDEEVREPRAIVFRTLEFAGSLATAIATGFAANDLTIRALGVGTGVGIPEGKKLWPDRWPGYKRNVVNYAMPNLLKVGKASTAPTYFLFFSKTELQGMILDSQLFRAPVLSAESSVQSASVNVANLAFDSIEVPFEVLRGPLGPTGELRIAAASEQILRADAGTRRQELAAAKAELAGLQTRVTATGVSDALAAFAARRASLSEKLQAAGKAADDLAASSLGTADDRAAFKAIGVDAGSARSAVIASLASVGEAIRQQGRAAGELAASVAQRLEAAVRKLAPAPQAGTLEAAGAEAAATLKSVAVEFAPAAAAVADRALIDAQIAAATARVAELEALLKKAETDLKEFLDAHGVESTPPQTTPAAGTAPKADTGPK